MAKTAEGIKDDRNGAFGIRCGRFPNLVFRLFGKMWMIYESSSQDSSV